MIGYVIPGRREENAMTCPKNEREEPKGTAEKWWDTACETFQSASFKANQYKRIVQKKIDLGLLHRKITDAHTDLGKLIDDLRGEGVSDLLAREEIRAQLQKLDSLKQLAATLEEEMEAIRAEVEPGEKTEGGGRPIF